MNFKWVKNKAQYQTGESLYLNRIRVGGYGWNSARSKSDEFGDSINWVGDLDLPSLTDKGKRVYGSNQEEVKAKLERVVTQWFKEAK